MSKEEKKLNIENYENIINTMYQEKMNKRIEKNEKVTFIHIGEKVKFTKLEEASVIILREEIRLKKLIEKQQKEIEKNQKFKEDVVNLIMLWDKKELPENNMIIETLETIMHEFSRLENIEDEKIQVAVEFVEEKRDKYWKDKIKEKIKEEQKEINIIEEAQEIDNTLALCNEKAHRQTKIETYRELLKENNND